jgi:hypothetical protein
VVEHLSSLCKVLGSLPGTQDREREIMRLDTHNSIKFYLSIWVEYKVLTIL